MERSGTGHAGLGSEDKLVVFGIVKREEPEERLMEEMQWPK